MTYQKVAFFIVTAGKTSNPTCFNKFGYKCEFLSILRLLEGSVVRKLLKIKNSPNVKS
jgi:hypothetical protein